MPVYDATFYSEDPLTPPPSSDNDLPSVVLPTTRDPLSQMSFAGIQKQYHPNRSASRHSGENLLRRMDNDKYAEVQEKFDIHYLFASRSEWQLAQWLTSSSLHQSEIITFLRLDYVGHYIVFMLKHC